MHRKLGSNQLCAGYNKYPGTDSVQETALLRLNHESPTGLGVDIRMLCPFQCGTVFAFSPHPTRGGNRGWVVSKAGFDGIKKI
ncbi:MAG TPA: hypothetical protein PKG71_03065 [Candidatus Woesebacteria bacterium]|nr:hypothetical protein [Candidatus Woesebacteria bacterium]